MHAVLKLRIKNLFTCPFYLILIFIILYLQMWCLDLFGCLCPLSSDSCQTFLLGIFRGFPWDSFTWATVWSSMSWTSYAYLNQELVSQVWNFQNPEDAPNGFLIEKVGNRYAFQTFQISKSYIDFEFPANLTFAWYSGTNYCKVTSSKMTFFEALAGFSFCLWRGFLILMYCDLLTNSWFPN